MPLRLFFAVFLTLATHLFAQGGASPNDQARFLAGLPVRDSALAAYSHDPQWAEHATAMDTAWGKADSRQLAKVRSWARGHVPGSGNGGTMYYMFSGPDFLYANTFFPNASTYILCGTEPVGQVPDITKIPRPLLDAGLQNLRLSLKTVLLEHYFITKDMRVDLGRNTLGRTLPILYVFLARTGHTINDVQYVNSPAQGVRITSGRQTIYYFKTDLAGGGSSGFLNWCARQGPGLSLVKCASYLMHSDNFSGVRNFLLQNSSVIVQDDSGIPLHSFARAGWGVDLYGTYTHPIELFANNYQSDLAAAYASGHPSSLDFAFGYHWQQDQGVLMVGTRGGKGTQVETQNQPQPQSKGSKKKRTSS